MNRNITRYPLPEGTLETIKLKMLNWANQFSISVFLDNNEYDNHRYHFFECLLAVDPHSMVEADGTSKDLDRLDEWHATHKDWLFGHLSYDYKQALFKNTATGKANSYNFPLTSFFCPATVCYIPADKRSLIIETIHPSANEILSELLNQSCLEQASLPGIRFKKRLDKERYLEIITSLKEHIWNGDCYEINFCNEGYAEQVTVDPLTAFRQLNTSAPAPFAAYYKYHDQYLLCSSPERYLCKQQHKIISQPIKGTIRRSTDRLEDEQLKQTLFHSEKDRAENVMIVDLTRNDLSIASRKGSIEVEELFGIYSYPRVHQMISTITGILENTAHFTGAIRHSFPMGSMTGAPKHKVMQLIDRYEPVRRELFSGSIGYITPQADFDFNVIIRSLFYNASSNYLSYQTGGAITYDSIPEQEWEEAALKALNLEQLFRA